MRSRFALAAVVLSVSLVAVGCGGSDDEAADPTAAWASGFCSAITTWTNTLEDVTSQFTDTSNFSEDALRDAADDVSSATDQLIEDVRGLGRPETDSGEEVESAVDSLSTTLETEVSNIRDTVDELSGITGLPTAISAITSSLSAMSSAFQSTLQTVQDADVDGELESALEDAPECDDLSS
jgi:hypothetical protein